MKADTPKNYRLVELRAENYQKLKAVAIKPDRAVYKISGRNEQGKSSLLDAVAAALGGKDSFSKVPVRKGEDKAEIFLDFGDLTVTRKIWNKDGGGVGHSVTVQYADGKKPRDPQSVLETLRGSPIADDPIEFATRLKPKERYDLLKKLVPNFDFEEQAQIRKTLFEDRTQVGRDFDRAAGAYNSIEVRHEPMTAVDVTELAAQLRTAGEHNATIDMRAKRREEVADLLESKRDRADQIEAELKALRDLIAAQEKLISEAQPLPAKIDTIAIEQAIMDAEATNATARKQAEKAAKAAERDGLEKRYDEMSKQIKAIDDAKAAAIASANLPVPEITFGDDDILLDGLPFEQASTARKIRVSTALLMALKPDLRVLLVREGSLLDDDSRKALEADAVANDFVVLMECVGAGDGSGVVIEDGEIV